MAEAIQVSKLRWRLVDETEKPLTVPEAFYLATRGGGAFWGRAGSFEEGYEADILVIEDETIRHPQELTVEQRLERLIYLAGDGQLLHKAVAGNWVL